MNDNKVKVNANVDVNGLFGVLLTILFITLKLCGVINWSWVWVLCPLWIGLALFIVVFLISVIVAIVLGK